MECNKCMERHNYFRRSKKAEIINKSAASDQILADLLFEKFVSVSKRGMFADTVYKPGSVFV